MQAPVRGGTLRPRRTSAFRETGLFDEDEPQSSTLPSRPVLKVRFRSKNDIFESHIAEHEDLEWEDVEENDSDTIQYVSIPPTPTTRPMAALIHRLGLLAFVLAIVITITSLAPFGSSTKPMLGASGRPFTTHNYPKRQGDPTNYCKRWSQQSKCFVWIIWHSLTLSRCHRQWHALSVWWPEDDIIVTDEQYLE
jgi:hypothetical protein